MTDFAPASGTRKSFGTERTTHVLRGHQAKLFGQRNEGFKAPLRSRYGWEQAVALHLRHKVRCASLNGFEWLTEGKSEATSITRSSFLSELWHDNLSAGSMMRQEETGIHDDHLPTMSSPRMMHLSSPLAISK